MSKTIYIKFPDITEQVTITPTTLRERIENYLAENNQGLAHIIFIGRPYTIEQIGEFYDRVGDQSTIHVITWPKLPTPQQLFERMHRDRGGWDVMSKQKPVATLSSGDTRWFSKNYEGFTEEQKTEFKNILSDFLSSKNGYPCVIQINFTTSENIQDFFYIEEFFNIACEVVGCTQEQAIEYISNWSSSSPQKSILIPLVFGDYYKRSFFRDDAIKNAEFLPTLRRYNERVGLPDPDQVPSFGTDYGGSKEEDYKSKYIKYKNKYLELKNKLK